MKHNKFIKTPIYNLLSEANQSVSLLGIGPSTIPASTYVMQSLFLKMTGFQEQKMKCILWDFATHDFDFRNESLVGRNANITNGMSTLSSKEYLYRQARHSIYRLGQNIEITEVYKKNIIDRVVDELQSLFHRSPLIEVNIRSFNNLDPSKFNIVDFVDIPDPNAPVEKQKIKIFKGDLLDRYCTLYSSRNQVAHNTLSFQSNFNSFRKLRDSNNGVFLDYFDWFALLMIIDYLFIDQYIQFESAIISSPDYYDVPW